MARKNLPPSIRLKHLWPVQDRIEQAKREYYRPDQYATWRAVIEWYSGNQAEDVRRKLMWEPGRTLGRSLPLEDRPANWPKRFQIALGVVVEYWLEEKRLDKEKLKSGQYLSLALGECAYLISQPAWPPMIEHDVTAMDGSRFYQIDCHTHTEKYSVARDGRVFKEGAYNPNTQNYDREEVSPDVLEQILDRCIQ